MSGEKYYIIHSGEDGLGIEEVTKEELLERITPNMAEEGETYYGDPEILSKMPECDDGYFVGHNNALVIIKGKIISPKAKKVVTEFEVE